ncbi:hypothetical protein [Clostridium niameyense]|uniref:hypothetical protein n=1 Tax=Clostridium niameyense TaxID=1622073 RepID=UPI00067EF1AD|nr:hypothetical protein [Clostridium niameyense]
MFVSLIPIKYNKTIKNYNGYYYTPVSNKFEEKEPVNVNLQLKSYTKFEISKLKTQEKFKGTLSINNNTYNLKNISYDHNLYIAHTKVKGSNDSITIFMSKDLDQIFIFSYKKTYCIWCGPNDLNIIKNFQRNFEPCK